MPDLSAVNPGDYLTQQHVPYVGMAFDNTHCRDEPDDSIWGFGYNGCLVPDDPPVAPDNYGPLYDYVQEWTGEDEPSIALFSSDNQSGKAPTELQTVSAEGAGFEVVYAEGAVPALEATAPDITPESVQQALANQEWQIEGLVGPVRYPDSTVVPTPTCAALLENTGTEWRVVRPYECSDVTHPVEN